MIQEAPARKARGDPSRVVQREIGESRKRAVDFRQRLQQGGRQRRPVGLANIELVVCNAKEQIPPAESRQALAHADHSINQWHRIASYDATREAVYSFNRPHRTSRPCSAGKGRACRARWYSVCCGSARRICMLYTLAVI